GAGWSDLRDDRRAPPAALADFPRHLLRDLLLRGRRVEDRGPVLRADVVALPIGGRRIVHPEEPPLEELGVRHLRRVEDDADGLGVPRPARPDVLVGGLVRLAPGVADLGLENARDTAEDLLHAPEAPAGEDRGLQ